MRAGKFLYHHCGLGRRTARESIVKGSLWINDLVVEDPSQMVGKFDTVVFEGQCIQEKKPRYLMLHKPAGYVCATKDDRSPTVMEFLPDELASELHIVGRLDKFTTGLVLLTNDGEWSRGISEPSAKQEKTYQVQSEDPISSEMLAAFRAGIFFEKEQVHTQPAEVAVMDDISMKLTIYEGMHHQIKRMFLKFGNRVQSLHRLSVAGQKLDVAEGEYRHLNSLEVASIYPIHGKN